MPERFLCKPKPPLDDVNIVCRAVDEIYFHRRLERSLVSGVSVPRYAGHISWLSCLEGTTNAPKATSLSGIAAQYPAGQRDDMVILAHIREQHRLSLQSYGRPRMTEELQEPGVNVGRRRPSRACLHALPGSGGPIDA